MTAHKKLKQAIHEYLEQNPTNFANIQRHLKENGLFFTEKTLYRLLYKDSQIVREGPRRRGVYYLRGHKPQNIEQFFYTPLEKRVLEELTKPVLSNILYEHLSDYYKGTVYQICHWFEVEGKVRSVRIYSRSRSRCNTLFPTEILEQTLYYPIGEEADAAKYLLEKMNPIETPAQKRMFSVFLSSINRDLAQELYQQIHI